MNDVIGNEKDLEDPFAVILYDLNKYKEKEKGINPFVLVLYKGDAKMGRMLDYCYKIKKNKMYIGLAFKNCLKERNTVMQWIEFDVYFRQRLKLYKDGKKWATKETEIQCENMLKAIRYTQKRNAARKRGLEPFYQPE